jgi:hypothetical protein
MGIKGLWTVCQDLDFGHPSPIAPGTRLLIDGPGWVFHLIESPSALSRRDGGDLSEVARRVREAITRFVRAGLVPEVWWDGT